MADACARRLFSCRNIAASQQIAVLLSYSSPNLLDYGPLGVLQAKGNAKVGLCSEPFGNCGLRLRLEKCVAVGSAVSYQFSSYCSGLRLMKKLNY
jgi:hypothetical protein